MCTDNMGSFYPSVFSFSPQLEFWLTHIPLLLSLLLRLPHHHPCMVWQIATEDHPEWPPCGRTALLKQINDDPGVVPCSLFQEPNPDATKKVTLKKEMQALNRAMLYFLIPAVHQIMRWNERIYNPWISIWAHVVTKVLPTIWCILFARFQETRESIEFRRRASFFLFPTITRDKLQWNYSQPTQFFLQI